MCVQLEGPSRRRGWGCTCSRRRDPDLRDISPSPRQRTSQPACCARNSCALPPGANARPGQGQRQVRRAAKEGVGSPGEICIPEQSPRLPLLLLLLLQSGSGSGSGGGVQRKSGGGPACSIPPRPAAAIFQPSSAPAPPERRKGEAPGSQGGLLKKLASLGSAGSPSRAPLPLSSRHLLKASGISHSAPAPGCPLAFQRCQESGGAQGARRSRTAPQAPGARDCRLPDPDPGIEPASELQPLQPRSRHAAKGLSVHMDLKLDASWEL